MFVMMPFQSRVMENLEQLTVFRLGRLPNIPDVALVFFISLPRFGPVNLFWSARYDKAMMLFLECLKDFAEFANSKDKENNIPQEKCFKLPYKIEIDKVESYSIKLSFNKQENWTKALKYTLNNLKWALHWFFGNTSFQPLAATVASHSDIPNSGSLHRKRPPSQPPLGPKT
ncbi:beclin-1-like protein [Tanacetum coccineum]